MQTNFRGRDFIGDLDFTKEEVEVSNEITTTKIGLHSI